MTVSKLALSALIVVVTGLILEARPEPQVPVVSSDPKVQGMIEAQLSGARLDPNARIASLNLTARPLGEVLAAVAKAGGVTVRFATGMTVPDTSTTVALTDQTVEDALNAALKGHSLTFQAMGPKTAFIYPDTPANREKYTASNRVFRLVKGDPMMLASELNRVLKPTADGFRAMVLTVRDTRTVIVRAVPELMTWIATWIAEYDK